MRYQIRRGCFETNSSSQHSIVVTKDDRRITADMLKDRNSDEYIYTKDGEISLCERDITFGRSPFRILTSFKEKMCFAIAEQCGWSKKPQIDFEWMEELIREIDPDIKKVHLPEESWHEGRTYYGEVDHQSCGVLKNFLAEKAITWKDFLLCRKYIIICDGDERDIWGTLKELSMINTDEIVEEYCDSIYQVKGRKYYEKKYQKRCLGNK